MRRISKKRILGTVDPADFIGRSGEIEFIAAHGAGIGGIAMLAAPTVGVSELLRQSFDRFFSGQDAIIPFYFQFRVSDGTARNAATRFLREFLLQTIAFRRRDARIIDASPEICELAELAVPADGYWIDRLVDKCNSESRLNDDRSFIRNCLSSPLRAAANGALSVVMIDDLHLTQHLDGGTAFFEDLNDIFSRASIPFIFAGQRRFLFGRTQHEGISVPALSFADAGLLAETLSANSGVLINDQTRDLIAVQFGGNAGHITAFFAAAASVGSDLSTFEHVQQIYTDELFGGRIGKYYDGIIELILPDAAIRAKALALLNETVRDGKVPVAYWKRHLGLAGTELAAVLTALNNYEIVNVSSGSVEFDSANIVLADYLDARKRLELDGEPRAQAVGESLADNIRRAPQLMARHYRRSSALGLRELMRAFDGRQISPAAVDYGRFKEELKGAADDKILRSLLEDNARITLPQIVYAAHTAAFYPSLNEICDAERSAVALGFTGNAEGDETAWIAAEIDSKLEATEENTAFWCDRLEMAALNCNFADFKIWLIAPEGFDDGALAILRERNAYGSSRKQVTLLAGLLNADVPVAEAASNEYEITIPMGEDTEMIAAHTIEEVAKRHNFPAKAINQIKTALVEACINAAEHSLSPDQKIHQKFSVDDEKITITVSNRGLRLADRKAAAEPAPDSPRRGWGLKLIRGLMDNVTLDQTDDGTRITMVKYLPAS